MLNWFRQVLQTRYVGLLEGEVARLRAENRALMNSLLGTAVFPPVEFPGAPRPRPLPRLRKRSWPRLRAWGETGANGDAAMSLEENFLGRPKGPVPPSGTPAGRPGGNRARRRQQRRGR